MGEGRMHLGTASLVAFQSYSAKLFLPIGPDQPCLVFSTLQNQHWKENYYLKKVVLWKLLGILPQNKEKPFNLDLYKPCIFFLISFFCQLAS